MGGFTLPMFCQHTASGISVKRRNLKRDLKSTFPLRSAGLVRRVCLLVFRTKNPATVFEQNVSINGLDGKTAIPLCTLKSSIFNSCRLSPKVL